MTYSQQQRLARAQLLQQQHRHGDAANELRQHLGVEPHDAVAHAMLAVSLLELNQAKDATAEAQQAVGLAPDLPYAHYVLAFVLFKRDWLDEAKQSAEEALRLESFNPNHFALLAAIEFARRNWLLALDHANSAMQIDPDHSWATNLRAAALVKLGRREEAARTMGDALAKDPEDPDSHANQGWTLLHQGNHKQARIHFRESLRLDPTNDWARQGMVEALKSGFWPYKVILLFWLWMSRLSRKGQWGVILGGYVGYQIARNVARNNPAAGKFLWPLIIAYLVFVLMTWLSNPLLTLVLRLHRDGRYALSREQILKSNLVGGLLATAVIALVLLGVTKIEEFVMLAVIAALLVFPVVTLFSAPRGWPRNLMVGVTIAMALLGSAIVTMSFTLYRGSGDPGLDITLLKVFVAGIIFSQIAVNALPMFRPKR